MKEDKGIVQQGSKDLGMPKPKGTLIPMNETMHRKVKMKPNFIIRIN